MSQIVEIFNERAASAGEELLQFALTRGRGDFDVNVLVSEWSLNFFVGARWSVLHNRVCTSVSNRLPSWIFPIFIKLTVPERS